MSTHIDFHKVASVKVRRQHITNRPDGAPDFWTATLVITDSDGNRQDVGLYSNSGAIVFDDPDAPAIPWADADADRADAEGVVLPPSVVALEAVLMSDGSERHEVPALASPDHLDLSEGSAGEEIVVDSSNVYDLMGNVLMLQDTLQKQIQNRQRTFLPGLPRWADPDMVQRGVALDEARGWDEAGEVTP